MGFNFTFTNNESKSGDIGEGQGQYNLLTKKVTFDGTQSDDDVVPLFPVHSNDIVSSGGYANDALSGMTDVDFGLYEVDGSVVVDADLFVDGDSMASAQNTIDGDSALAASHTDKIDYTQRVYELLGLSEDPGKIYMLCMTLNTAGSASGDMVVRYGVTRNT